MEFELHVNSRCVKLWHFPYRTGPFPMDEEMMEEKEQLLEKRKVECLVDAGQTIYTDAYELYVVQKSECRPDRISDVEFYHFQKKADQIVKHNKLMKELNNLNSYPITSSYDEL